jgi:sortase A
MEELQWEPTIDAYAIEEEGSDEFDDIEEGIPLSLPAPFPTTSDQELEDLLSELKPLAKKQGRDVRAEVVTLFSNLAREGGRQYAASLSDSVRVGKSLSTESKDALGRMWAFLLQPVWVPGRNTSVREHRRCTLFVLDTLRFGATFAGLFVVLFVSMNYQSFWEIAKAQITSLQPQIGEEQTDELTKTLSEHLQTPASNASADLAMMLPPVGPPENRLIIPSLKLNVPIVIPPIDALLQENWTQLEGEIQSALEQGVVHYPGTARPGQAGNFFLTGHSSYYPWAGGKYKSVFARLTNLKEGDEYWVYYGGDKHRYRVEKIEEVLPSDVHVLDQPADARTATLMTCTPVGTTLRRLIVSAIEIDPETGEALDVGEYAQQELPKLKLPALPI